MSAYTTTSRLAPSRFTWDLVSDGYVVTADVTEAERFRSWATTEHEAQEELTRYVDHMGAALEFDAFGDATATYLNQDDEEVSDTYLLNELTPVEECETLDARTLVGDCWIDVSDVEVLDTEVDETSDEEEYLAAAEEWAKGSANVEVGDGVLVIEGSNDYCVVTDLSEVAEAIRLLVS